MPAVYRARLKAACSSLQRLAEHRSRCSLVLPEQQLSARRGSKSHRGSSVLTLEEYASFLAHNEI